jgi:hypothetical protein
MPLFLYLLFNHTTWLKRSTFFIFIYYGLHYLANKYYWENKNYTS